MAQTQGEIRVGPGNQVKDIYVRWPMRSKQNTVTPNSTILDFVLFRRWSLIGIVVVNSVAYSKYL